MLTTISPHKERKARVSERARWKKYKCVHRVVLLILHHNCVQQTIGTSCGTLDRLPSSHHRPKKDVNAFIEGFDQWRNASIAITALFAVEPNQCNLSECKVGDSSIVTLLGRTRITRMRRLSFRQKLCTCSSLWNKSPMAEEGAQGACHVETNNSASVSTQTLVNPKII